MIKPLKITDQEEHAVLIYNQEELDPANHTCGVRNVGRKQGLIRTSRSLKRPEVEDIINNVLSLFVKKDFLQAEKYIDLFLVLDNAFGKRKNSVSLVGVMAHELGHVLGMPDVPYNTNCPSGSCVMNEYLSSKFPKDFSTVSRSHFKKYILSQKPRCLLQTLVPKNMMIKPVCGNQLLEVGEVCDCGSPEV
ncbi:ADAM DEC1, partial [Eschrichtius robustus]|nr:ADAM DEC1 [Eschrichtius robustus]